MNDPEMEFSAVEKRYKMVLSYLTILDDYKIKEQGFFEPSPIYSYKVLIDRVDQDDHFDSGITSVGQLPPTQFKV